MMKLIVILCNIVNAPKKNYLYQYLIASLTELETTACFIKQHICRKNSYDLSLHNCVTVKQENGSVKCMCVCRN